MSEDIDCNELLSKLETINFSDYEKVYEQLMSIGIEKYENKVIAKSFEILTDGEFVITKVCSNHAILNKYPHIVYNNKTKKFKYPKPFNSGYIVDIKGNKVMHILVAEEFLNYIKIKGDPAIKFKDDNRFNYRIDNIILPSKENKQTDKKKTKQTQIVEYPDGSFSTAADTDNTNEINSDDWNEDENKEYIDPRDTYVKSSFTMNDFQDARKTVSKDDDIEETISLIRSVIARVGSNFMVRISNNKRLKFDCQYILYEKLNFCDFTLCGMKNGNRVKMSFSEFFKHYRVGDQNMANFQTLKQFQNWENIMKSRTFVYDAKYGTTLETEYMKLATEPTSMKRLFDDLAELIQNQSVYQRLFILMGKGKEGKTLLTRFIASMFHDDNNITVDEKMVLKDKFNSYMESSYVNFTEFNIKNEIDSIEFTSLLKILVDGDYKIRGMNKEYKQIIRRCLLTMTTNDIMLSTILRSKYRQQEFETCIWSKIQPILLERNEDSQLILDMEKMLIKDSYELGWQLTQYFMKREMNIISEVRAIPSEFKDKLYDEYNSAVDIAVLDEMPKILKVMIKNDANDSEKWKLANRDSVFVERQSILNVISGRVIEERLAERLRNQGFVGPMQHDVSKSPRVRISGYRISRRDAEVLYERYYEMNNDNTEESYFN